MTKTRTKRAHTDTTVPHIAADPHDIMAALLPAPPPPAGDPSNGKRVRKSHEQIEASREKNRQRKARFDAAHAKGMKALAKHDYGVLDEAIGEEGDIVGEMTEAINRKAAAPRRKKKGR
jgi:hypothetical protein